MRRITLLLPSVASPAVPFFSILSRQMHDFFLGGGKFIEYKMSVFFSTNLSDIFPILRIIQRDIIINIHKYSCKVPDILVRF